MSNTSRPRLFPETMIYFWGNCETHFVKHSAIPLRSLHYLLSSFSHLEILSIIQNCEASRNLRQWSPCLRVHARNSEEMVPHFWFQHRFSLWPCDSCASCVCTLPLSDDHYMVIAGLMRKPSLETSPKDSREIGCTSSAFTTHFQRGYIPRNRNSFESGNHRKLIAPRNYARS